MPTLKNKLKPVPLEFKTTRLKNDIKKALPEKTALKKKS